MKKDNKNFIEIEGEIYSLFLETATSLRVSKETLAMMAISQFLNSPLATSSVQKENSTAYSTPQNIPLSGHGKKNMEHIIEYMSDGNDYSWKSVFEQIKNIELDYDKIDDEAVSGVDITNPSTILWGQYSRFLPTKVSLRILALLMSEKEDHENITIDNWFFAICEYIGNIGVYLTHSDILNRPSKGEGLSTGFPNSGDRYVKSVNRFLSHFCAQEHGKNNHQSFPVELGLILIRQGESEGNFLEYEVSLSKKGLEYTSLMNPVIDKAGKESMSADEQIFMIKRLKENLPASWGFLQFILTSISNDNNTPTLLSSEISSSYGKDSSRKWNDKQISSYRTGAIGLLGDLGLITRSWNFRSVTYHLTPEGFDIGKISNIRGGDLT